MQTLNELTAIAIVGRPNVGKSTLFNRLCGKRISIVDDRPGVTRDSIISKTAMDGKPCYIVDTGGLTHSRRKEGLEAEIEKHILRSITWAKAAVFLVDGSSGPMPDDKFVAGILRREGLKTIFVINKCDGPEQDIRASNFFELGMGEPICVSALHGRNFDQLRTAIAEYLPDPPPPEKIPRRITFSLVGRPNVGKSSLTNAILGWDRCVVNNEPGTTRDSIATDFDWDGEPFTIVDTAGQRRRKKNLDDVEFYSITRAVEAIKKSDVGVLVIDAHAGLLEGDKRIAAAIIENKRGFLLVVNKMDLVEAELIEDFIKYIQKTIPFLATIPMVFVSALNSKGMDSILGNIAEIYTRQNTPLPLKLLENVIYDVRQMFSPKGKGRGSGRIDAVIHDRVNPPRIVLKVDDKDAFTTDYIRMIENRIREVFNLSGVPLDLSLSAPPKKPKK